MLVVTCLEGLRAWIPAFAGMTLEEGCDGEVE